MIQPYLSAVDYERERSLMFVAGDYSHAVLRTAFNPGGQHSEDPYDASAAEIDFARETVAAAESILGEAFAYARVDLIPSAQGPMLMELELVEPSLFLIHCPQAAEDFAALLDAAWKTAPEFAALEAGFLTTCVIAGGGSPTNHHPPDFRHPRDKPEGDGFILCMPTRFSR